MAPVSLGLSTLPQYAELVIVAATAKVENQHSRRDERQEQRNRKDAAHNGEKAQGLDRQHVP